MDANDVDFKRGRASHICLSILGVVNGVAPSKKYQITEAGRHLCVARTHLTCDSVSGGTFWKKQIPMG